MPLLMIAESARSPLEHHNSSLLEHTALRWLSSAADTYLSIRPLSRPIEYADKTLTNSNMAVDSKHQLPFKVCTDYSIVSQIVLILSSSKIQVCYTTYPLWMVAGYERNQERHLKNKDPGAGARKYGTKCQQRVIPKERRQLLGNKWVNKKMILAHSNLNWHSNTLKQKSSSS